MRWVEDILADIRDSWGAVQVILRKSWRCILGRTVESAAVNTLIVWVLANGVETPSTQVGRVSHVLADHVFLHCSRRARCWSLWLKFKEAVLCDWQKPKQSCCQSVLCFAQSWWQQTLTCWLLWSLGGGVRRVTEQTRTMSIRITADNTITADLTLTRCTLALLSLYSKLVYSPRALCSLHFIH